MRCHHIWSPVDDGLDECIECGVTAHNPDTAPDRPLSECGCGRGLARFSGTGEPPVCASCFAEGIRGEAVA